MLTLNGLKHWKQQYGPTLERLHGKRNQAIFKQNWDLNTLLTSIYCLLLSCDQSNWVTKENMSLKVFNNKTRFCVSSLWSGAKQQKRRVIHQGPMFAWIGNSWAWFSLFVLRPCVGPLQDWLITWMRGLQDWSGVESGLRLCLICPLYNLWDENEIWKKTDKYPVKVKL